VFVCSLPEFYTNFAKIFKKRAEDKNRRTQKFAESNSESDCFDNKKSHFNSLEIGKINISAHFSRFAAQLFFRFWKEIFKNLLTSRNDGCIMKPQRSKKARSDEESP
jgi:hypothetical protein